MLGLLAGLMRADLTMTEGASRDGMHDAFDLGRVVISSLFTDTNRSRCSWESRASPFLNLVSEGGATPSRPTSCHLARLSGPASAARAATKRRCNF